MVTFKDVSRSIVRLSMRRKDMTLTGFYSVMNGLINKLTAMTWRQSSSNMVISYNGLSKVLERNETIQNRKRNTLEGFN